MLEYMEQQSFAEADQIRKTIQDLLRSTCILQVKCDPVTLIQRDNPRYQVCIRHREFISDYLAVLGCDLIHDPQDHIFRIAGDGAPTEKLSLTATKLVLLIKLIYRSKIMGEGLSATVTSLAEIREYGKDTNLITRKLTRQEWQEALILMKTHQILELPGAIGNLEDDTPIYIYSTINLFCSAVDINELVSRYRTEAEDSAGPGSEEPEGWIQTEPAETWDQPETEPAEAWDQPETEPAESGNQPETEDAESEERSETGAAEAEKQSDLVDRNQITLSEIRMSSEAEHIILEGEEESVEAAEEDRNQNLPE